MLSSTKKKQKKKKKYTAQKKPAGGINIQGCTTLKIDYKKKENVFRLKVIFIYFNFNSNFFVELSKKKADEEGGKRRKEKGERKGKEKVNTCFLSL